MSKGIAIIFDDNEKVIDRFETFFEELKINLELKSALTVSDFKKLVKTEDIVRDLKLLIFDLAKDKGETVSKSFEIEKYIEEYYHRHRVPIFVHSSYVEHFKKYDNYGTVFKVMQDKGSIRFICDKIKMMESSEFLNIFSCGGTLDNKILEELHKSFTEQFKNNEIEETIKSILEHKEIDHKKRIQEVFERIAIRSLYNNIMDSNEGDKDVDINSIEHYYRRRRVRKIIWTGDIFVSKSIGKKAIVLTPRCNIENGNYKELLLCYIDPLTEDQEKAVKKYKILQKALKSNVQFVSEKSRYLIKTPLFNGGLVNFSECFTIKEENLVEDFNYLISISEELTNDITRRFSSYLLRSGVSESDIIEALYYQTAE